MCALCVIQPANKIFRNVLILVLIKLAMSEKETTVYKKEYENGASVVPHGADDGIAADQAMNKINGFGCAGAGANGGRHETSKINECDTGECYDFAAKDIGRRRAVPVLYSRGSHYQIGFDVGRTFGSLIASYIAGSDRLREFERRARSPAGLAAYAATLENVSRRTPQYVSELHGVADGAGVQFRKLFLLHMDDIMETIDDEAGPVTPAAVGCTSIGVLRPGVAVLGHTEDALEETLNHFYILSAHVVPSDEERSQGVREERFTSLCYAGQLPGYTMGFTSAGMVFSINTLSPRRLRPGRTPRVFLTRAMLAAKNPDEARRILLDEGLGAGNGFSVNMLWKDATGSKGTTMYNIEVAPSKNDEARSQLDVHCYSCPPGAAAAEPLIHCNRYKRLHVEEVKGPIIDSSVSRMKVIHSQRTPAAREQIVELLSDISGSEYRIFESRMNRTVVTIAVGIFDLEAGTWSLYIDEPATSEPVAVLPLTFTPRAVESLTTEEKTGRRTKS